MVNNDTRSIEDEIIDAISMLAASVGLNRIAGQIYAALYLSEKPLSLDDLTHVLKVSKGHISTNVRALEKWQAVSSVWIKGSRKDYYQANRDAIGIMSRQLKTGLVQRLALFETALAQAKQHLSAGETTQSDLLKKRINELEGMLRGFHRLVDRMDLMRLIA